MQGKYFMQIPARILLSMQSRVIPNCVIEGDTLRYEKAGCIALCNSEGVVRGSCSGSGCCQASLLTGWQGFNIKLFNLENQRRITNQSCSYAFFARIGSFVFGGASDMAKNSTALVDRLTQQVPIVLDWNVKLNTSCKDAKKINSSSTDNPYLCQLSTECIDTDLGGYRCSCLPGFEGNPYLKPGCIDIDECTAGPNNPCSMACVNNHGSFRCSCPKGYLGDGLKSGNGCTKVVDKSSSTLKKITLGLGISLGTILLLVGWWFSSVIKKRRIIRQKAMYFERNGGLLLQQQMATDEGFVAAIKIFTIDELEKATDHFNEDRILGKGQGIVYKGMLSEGRIVAVKKSKLGDESQLGDFINEVVILSQINHRNIVRLLDCCLETEVPYKFMNTFQMELSSSIFIIQVKIFSSPGECGCRLLLIQQELLLICIHHLQFLFFIEIKSSNILLDEKYKAKLSDFGTSKTVDVYQTHVTSVMGTFEYLDPEYFQSSQFTEKSDVYSFGVVLVELLTGEKAVRSVLKEDRSLASWFLSHLESSRLLDIIDSRVLKEGSKEEFLTIANVAKQCLNLDGKRRPTMKEVLLEIEGVMSLHLPQANDQEQECNGTTKNMYFDGLDGVSSFNTSYLGDTSLCSAEMSLLFNPR